jgi:Ca-activated chloride channel family protein
MGLTPISAEPNEVMEAMNRWREPGGVMGVFLFGVLALLAMENAKAADPPALMLIVDGSGSMWGALDATRQSKSALVREALRSALGKVNPQTRVGLAAFGHRRSGDCNDVEIIRQPEPLDADRIMAPLAQVNPRGRGPLTLALREAAKALPQASGPRRLLLIHDDADNCQADVCEAAAYLRSTGIVAHVVGIGTKAEDVPKMACLPQITGGRYFNAQTAEQVASLVEEAMIAAAQDGDAKGSPSQPRTTSLVAPQPVPASGPPALYLRALLAANTAPPNTPLHWIVSPEGQPGLPLYNAWAVSPVVPVTAGRYSVEVGDGLVAARQTIAAGDRPVAVTLLLGAGRVHVRVKAQRTGAPLRNAVVTISGAGKQGDGKKEAAAGLPVAAYKGDEASALLPVGRFVVRAELGLVRAEKAIAISAGQELAVEFSLNAAILQLTTAGRDGVRPLEDPIFILLEDDPDAPSGRREIARSAGRPAEFVVPPGTYYAIARQGSIEARERLAIGPGDLVKQTLSAPAGRLRLSAKTSDGVVAADNVSYTIQRVDESTLEPISTSDPSPALFLPPGRYRIEGRYGLMNVASTRVIEISAGQEQEVTFEHQAATLKLRLHDAGQAKEVFWGILDQSGRAVWASAQAETVATLQAGSYLISAETREKRYERRIDLRPGENRVVDIGG